MNNMPIYPGESYKRRPPDQGGFSVQAFEWLEAVGFALAIVVVVFTFFFRIVSVNGQSMMPTLHDKERVIISSLFYTPHDGDIIIIAGLAQDDPHKLRDPIVKRVVATAGETIRFTEDGRVEIDGVVQYESFDLIINHGNAYEYPLTVPEGKVFVMGDNRNNSTDSRSISVGLVNVTHILGKVELRIYPVNKIGIVH